MMTETEESTSRELRWCSKCKRNQALRKRRRQKSAGLLTQTRISGPIHLRIPDESSTFCGAVVECE